MRIFRASPVKRNGEERPSRGDRGATLVEMLIGISILGTVAAATLTGMIVVITASSLDRDHANAHAWLQTSADILYARDLDECDPLVDPVTEIDDTIAAYQDTIRQTDNPEGWDPSNISVVGLEWWSIDVDSSTGVGTEAWGTTCDSGDTNLQRVSIQVQAEDGRIVEQVEVIIGD